MIYKAIGLMSGTSMDGVDAALIETDGIDTVFYKSESFIPYPSSFQSLLKELESTIKNQHGVFDVFQKINNVAIQEIIDESTQFHIKAIELLNAKADIIGYHGQTFYHKPEDKISVILGNPHLMAKTLSTPVVFDFRKHDIESGGKGAPLAPLYHYVLAKDYAPCAFVNCGGISNITIIPSTNLEDISAYDCGPGNCLIDRFVKMKTNRQFAYDKDGIFSSKGTVFESIQAQLLQNTCGQFYDLLPPKALDVQDLQLPSFMFDLSLEDGCLNLAEFTARIIAEQAPTVDYWILSGGGFYNPSILKSIKKHLCGKTVKTADEMGWHLKSIEAQLFAYLAVRSVKKLPLSFPKTTSVPYPMTGGVVYNPL